MSSDRRLTAIETALSPTELVCRWLDEAHAFDGLDAYTSWLIDQPVDALPQDRLLREAADGVRARRGRRKAAEVDDAVRQAYRGTLFRFELVLRINLVVHEAVERETLVRTVLSLRVAMLLDDKPARDTGVAQAQALLLMDERARYLHQLEAARVAVEAKYLAGRPALFPAELRRWDEARHEADQMVALGARLGELDGWLPSAEPDSPEALEEAIDRLIDDFVEPAKVQALEKLDEGRRAFAIATRWLRGKTAHLSVATDPGSPPTASTR